MLSRSPYAARCHATWSPAIAALALIALVGCHRDMYDQPRLEPLEKNTFFDDGRASRPLVAGVVEYCSISPDSGSLPGTYKG